MMKNLKTCLPLMTLPLFMACGTDRFTDLGDVNSAAGSSSALGTGDGGSAGSAGHGGTAGTDQGVSGGPAGTGASAGEASVDGLPADCAAQGVSVLTSVPSEILSLILEGEDLYVATSGTKDELGNLSATGSIYRVKVPGGEREELVSGLYAPKLGNLDSGALYFSETGANPHARRLDLTTRQITEYGSYDSVLGVGDVVYLQRWTDGVVSLPLDGTGATTPFPLTDGAWRLKSTSYGPVAFEATTSISGELLEVVSLAADNEQIGEYPFDCAFIGLTEQRRAVYEVWASVQSRVLGADLLVLSKDEGGLSYALNKGWVYAWAYSVASGSDPSPRLLRFPSAIGRTPDVFVDQSCQSVNNMYLQLLAVSDAGVVWTDVTSKRVLMKAMTPHPCQADVDCSMDSVVCGTDGYCVPG